MGKPNPTTYVPGGDRVRKASSPVESRLRDVIAHHQLTAALWRRGVQLVDLATVQECRASSLWRIGGKWAVAAIDVAASYVNVFDEEGPARDKHHRTTARLASKPPHELTKHGRKKGPTGSASDPR